MSFTSPIEGQSGSYILDHWRGLHPLPQAYWINTFLVSAISAIGAFAASEWLSGLNLRLQTVAIFELSFSTALIAITIWSIVGVWRSAEKHAERGGSVTWASIAKAISILSALGLLGQVTQAIPGHFETAQLASGSDPMGKPARVQFAGAATLELEGPISLGTVDQVSAALESSPDVKTIVLNSIGGRLLEANQIAEIIRRKSIDTVADGNCESACTVVLLAGQKRTANPGARIGFHQPSYPGLTPEQQAEMVRGLRKTYTSVGLPSWFVKKAMEPSADEMWYPTEIELSQSGVLTGFNSRFLASNNKNIAKNFNLQTPIQIDEITKLVKVNAEGPKLIYDYAVNALKSDFDLAIFRNEILDQNTKEFCDQPLASELLNSGMIVSYRYYDKSKQLIATIVVAQC